MIKHLVLLLACGVLAMACSGGSQDTGLGEADVVLAQTPADGVDRFVVDVSDITLTKRGGSTISVLPRATRVDFVQLRSIGELVAGCRLESGSYTSVSLTLDFTNAEVVIAGQPVPAVVRDCEGVILDGPLVVDIDLTEGARPFVGVARRHLFRFALDLGESLDVDAAANEVTFCPVVRFDVDPSDVRAIAVAGVLESVAVGDLTFRVARRARDGSAGDTFTVQANERTVFQIDGVIRVGASGLGALVGAIGQRVWVQGTRDEDRQLLHAVAVEAGAGVPGNGQDTVSGLVVGRSGGAGADAQLTIQGRAHSAGGDGHHGNTLFTVSVSLANTKVLRRLTSENLDADAINIGQEVEAFGDFSGTTLDATAATGVVRLLPTSLQGTAAGAPTDDLLTVSVERFGNLEPARFDFSVGGAVQADPLAFTIDVGGLSTAGIGAGDRLRMLAWIHPVGMADDADAAAISLTDRDNLGVPLTCRWSPPGNTVVTATTPVSITLDVTAAGRAAVGSGMSAVDIADTPAPTIRPAGAFGIYRIVGGGRGSAHRQFDSFRQAVAERATRRSIVRVDARGAFDAATQEFRATSVTFVFARQ